MKTIQTHQKVESLSDILMRKCYTDIFRMNETFPDFLRCEKTT